VVEGRATVTSDEKRQRSVTTTALEVIPPSNTEVAHWTSAKELQEALTNVAIKDQKVMVAVPYKRVLKPRYLEKAVVIDSTGVYPIVAIQELETEDGEKVLVFIGSDDQPPLEGPIKRRRQ
jgi:predicted homoserine dehydrogenase-like protein